MERAGVPHLYPRLLGPAWFDLDPVVRQVHAADQVITATLEIRHGKGLIARIVRAALRLPMSTDGRKTTLRITSDARTERWTRTFGRRSLVTVQRALSDGCRSLGDVYAGERVTHAVMGILYGAALAILLPALATWWRQPTALRLAPADVPEPLRWLLLVMATGVFVSGARDLYSAAGLPHGAWPWATRRPA